MILNWLNANLDACCQIYKTIKIQSLLGTFIWTSIGYNGHLATMEFYMMFSGMTLTSST